MWLKLLAGIIMTMSQINRGNTKLLFLQTMSRHGDRAPLKPYKWDLTPSDFWPEGYGNLTELGKRQNYVLGKFLRLLYSGFLTSNPNEVIVNSTDEVRCISSGQYLISSYFYSEPKWDNIDRHSIPVYYQTLEKDKYLSLQRDCPRSNDEIEKMYSSPDFLQISAKYQATLTALSPHMGPIFSPYEIQMVKDALFVLKKYNQTLSFWPNIFYDEISEYSDFISFYPWTNPEVIRLMAGPILGKIVDDMKRKISGEIHTLKLQAYDVQSHLLIVVMDALGVFNNLLPPYCATLIFELHGMPNGTNAVRLLYLNSTVPENGYQVPHVLTIEGCSEFCPMDFFDNYTKQYVPEDWEDECGLTNNSTYYLIGFTLAFVLVLLIIALLFYRACVFNKKICAL